MVSLQIISKILNTKDFSIIENNQLDETYFTNYEDEFNFLKSYYDKYNSVPDKETFLDKFEDFELLSNVNTDDRFLVEALKNEYILNQSIPVLNRVSELLEGGDSINAIDYLSSQLGNLQISTELTGKDIIETSKDRYSSYQDRISNQEKWFFKTGFPQLDDVIHGIQRGEEFIVLFARINKGKSWILEKMATSVWEQGYNVGYISPEMGYLNVGYRFDTLHKNFDNNSLVWGNSLENEEEYKKYTEELSKSKNKFIVSTLKDFNNRITISKIKKWIKQNSLDIICIDDMKYLTDDRGSSRDSIVTKLTNISEDLMSLSVELGIPVLSVIQANRNGTEDETGRSNLEMENIYGSDGPAMNASKVLSINQRGGILEIGIKKQRNGPVGSTIKYMWNINKGEFIWLPSKDDSVEEEIKEAEITKNKDMFSGDIEDVF